MDVQRLFIYNARKTIVARGPADRIDLTAWLVQQLDRPSPPAATAEYELPEGADNQNRVFYLPHIRGSQQLMTAATQIRTSTGTPRLFINNALAAVGVRGTVSQIATAEKVIEEMGQAK